MARRRVFEDGVADSKGPSFQAQQIDALHHQVAADRNAAWEERILVVRVHLFADQELDRVGLQQFAGEVNVGVHGMIRQLVETEYIFQ